MITLRDYQTAAVLAARTHKGHPMIVLATGLGKTTVMCEYARLEIAEGLPDPILCLAHRKELLDQIADRFRDQTGLLVARRVKDYKPTLFELRPDVVVESVQTIDSMLRRGLALPKFSRVILDEAHHAASQSYGRVFSSLAYVKWLALTATPDRQDAAALPFDLVFDYGMERGVRDGWLSPLEYKLFQVNAPSEGKIRVQAGDFVLTDLANVLNNSNEKILEIVGKEARGKRAIAFFPTVETAQWFAKEFCALGFRSDVVHGGTPAKERDEKIASYRQGAIDILCNCAVLTEGFDAPETDCVIMARPTKSESLYRQCVGRGSRRAPGKERCSVLHFGFEFFGDFEVHPKRIGAASECIELEPLMAAAMASREAFEKSTGELLEVRDALVECVPFGLHQLEESYLDRSATKFAEAVGFERQSFRTDPMLRAASHVLPGFFQHHPQPGAYCASILSGDKARRRHGLCDVRSAWFLWRWRLPPNAPRVIAARWINEIKEGDGLRPDRRKAMIAELRLKIEAAIESKRIAA